MRTVTIELDDAVYDKLAAEARALHAGEAEVFRGTLVDTESGRPLDLDLESHCAQLAASLVEEHLERRQASDPVADLEERLEEARQEIQRLHTTLGDLKSYM